jgi:hypothetical protein
MGILHNVGYGCLGVTVIAAVSLSSLSTVGCGPSKPAKDPTTETTSAKQDDDVPKWDSSSETAENPKPRSSTSSSGGGGAGSAPFAPAATARRTDVYDQEATEVVLKRAARQVKDNCGFAANDDGKQAGPWGKTNISIVLGHNGHSKGATIPSPYEGKPTGKCAVQAFSNLTFPPWSGPDTTVEWPIEIAAPTK